MTTQFDSKETAISVACTYAGVGTEALKGVIPKLEQKYHPLDDEHEFPEDIEVYTIKNKEGVDCSFGICKFRSGFDLWIIGDNGMMVRV